MNKPYDYEDDPKHPGDLIDEATHKMESRQEEPPPPKPGDIVSFMTRAHPIMGKEYEVIGRVQNDARGLHAGNRYLWTATGPITIIQSNGGSNE